MTNESEESSVFSDEELAMLGDEERAALSDDDEGAEGQNEQQNPDESEKSLAEDPVNEGDIEREGLEAEDGSENKEITEKEPDPVQQETEPKQDEVVTKDDNEKVRGLEEIDSELEGLATRMEDGDLDFSQYHKENLRLMKERQEVIVNQERENTAVEIQRQEHNKVWNAAINEFVNDPANIRVKENQVIAAAFNATLQSVYNSPEMQGHTPQWALDQAKKQLSDSGIHLSANNELDGSKNTRSVSNKRSVKEEIPVTLGQVPAAGSNTISSDEFSGIDKLDGMELEAALMKMSPDQVDRYLNK